MSISRNAIPATMYEVAQLLGTRCLSMATDTAFEPKSTDEHRIERLTWFGIVGVLVVSGALPNWLTLHNGITALATGLILIFSGILQHRRGIRVAYSTWVAGTLLLVMAGFSFLSRPELDLSLLVILSAIFVVGAGVFTRET